MEAEARRISSFAGGVVDLASQALKDKKVLKPYDELMSDFVRLRPHFARDKKVEVELMQPGDPGGLGRMFSPDARDQSYLMSMSGAPLTDRQFRYWWPSGWWGNQGYTPQCVAYAWLHLLEDGPVTQAPFTPGAGPLLDPYTVYRESQRNDEWAGENYDGTSVRAGAKVLQRQGLITNYIWAYDLWTVTEFVLSRGPVVAGTWWYRGMDTPDENGFIRPTGAPRGGHAYIINGVSLTREVFRIKNSWGRGWGRRGHAYITFNDFLYLMHGGEFCAPTEVRRPE